MNRKRLKISEEVPKLRNHSIIGYISTVNNTVFKNDLLVKPKITEPIYITGIYDLDCKITKYLLTSITAYDKHNKKVFSTKVLEPVKIHVQDTFFSRNLKLMINDKIVHKSIEETYHIEIGNGHIKENNYISVDFPDDIDIDTVYPHRF